MKLAIMVRCFILINQYYFLKSSIKRKKNTVNYNKYSCREVYIGRMKLLHSKQMQCPPMKKVIKYN